MDEITKMRYKVDRIVSERSFLSRREQSEQLAFEAAKGSCNEKLEKYKTNLERESSEGKKVQIKLQELQILLTDERAKVDSLNNYTVKAKEYTAEIKRLNDCAGKPRSNIAKLKIQVADIKFELESKKRKSGMMEQNLSLQVTRMNLKKKNNELKWATFKKNLEIKNPVYANVKIEAFENDTVYEALKSLYAGKSIKAAKLRDNIEVLEKKCTELREKSKIKHEERRIKMNETKMLLKTKGEILTTYDKRKYQLLIEKEQFVAANDVIKKQNSRCKNTIGTMQFSDRVLANQIKRFTEGLRCLKSNISGAREDFIKFAAETKTRGKRIIFELEELVQSQETKTVVYSSLIKTCTKLNYTVNTGKK